MVFKPKKKQEEKVEEDAEAKIKRLNEETKALEAQIAEAKDGVQEVEPEVEESKDIDKTEIRDIIEGHLNRALGLLRYL